MDLSDMIPSLAEAPVPEHVLKTWSALPTAVRKALVDSELNQAGLSISSSGIATSSLTDDRADDGAPIHDIGLSLSNSFGSTIKTEDSADADTSDFIDDFRNDTEDARRNLSRTPRTSRTHRTNYSSASIITVTVSNLPPSNSSPPHLLGLRPPRDSEDASLHAPPVLQVLNRMPEYPIIGEHIKQKLEYSSLIDLLPDGAGSAVLPTESDKRAPLTHDRLRNFIENFDSLARDYGIRPGDRVGIAMPNGPELGICLPTICSRACAVPVNPDGTTDELRRDLQAVHAKVVIALEGAEHIEDAARQMNIPIIHLIPSTTTCGLFTISSPSGRNRAQAVAPTKDQLTAPQDHALVLFTSGTSGKKKVVPYTLSNMIVGAACIIKSWDLRPDDVNLNMMPLSHM